MDGREIERELPKGILNWYHFDRGNKVLCVSRQNSIIAEVLQERGLHVTVADAETVFQEKFDYIVAINSLEYCKNVNLVLYNWKQMLTERGCLLLGMENRLGLRYFCGDQDPFTKQNFDGIEHYRRVRKEDKEKLKGRNYARYEMERMLDEAGILNRRFYSVLPGLDMPQLIYAEDYLPEEELGNRYFPRYHNPDTVFLEEEHLYTDLIQNGMFHAMANAYLIECPLDSVFSNMRHVTLSMDRGRENALVTIIRRDRKVEKKALYSEGTKNIEQLAEHSEKLSKYGIKTVAGNVEQGSYIMPYIKAENGVQYFQRLARQNQQAFISEVDRYREVIRNSSEIVGVDENGERLKDGYLDLVPLNCFVENGEFLFFDQEFCQENYPVDAILLRSIIIMYACDTEMESRLPKRFFYERYGLSSRLSRLEAFSSAFLTKLLKRRELKIFYEKHQKNAAVVNTNRQRMNYSNAAYQKIFIDIFRDTEYKKVVLFGAGSYAERFLSWYKEAVMIVNVIDNNEKNWGNELEGIPIIAPEKLVNMNQDDYKVIICIKNYNGAMKQLEELGVTDYAIYDPNMVYTVKKKALQKGIQENLEASRKKYHTGYIAGVFDLFHIGHLNMFKRAKEQCEYLVVGVVTDEGVRKNKHVEPYIPFQERIEMVRSCQYVDEAVEIPFEHSGIRDAYRLHHFDVQFSGSDYRESVDWLADKKYLEKQGAEMIFFPYTEATSSSKIKALIDKRLL